MITLFLSIILGIAGIIPPEHFDYWLWAELIEFMLDIPATLIISKIIYSKEDKK